MQASEVQHEVDLPRQEVVKKKASRVLDLGLLSPKP